MNNSKKRIITDCAVCTAVTVILLVVGYYVPIFGLAAHLFCGVPVAYIIFKHSGLAGTLTALCIIASAYFAMSVDSLVFAVFPSVFILPALVFSIFYKKFGEKRFYSALWCTSLAYLIIYAVIVYILNGDGNGIRNMLTATAGAMTESLKQSFASVSGGDFSSFEKVFSDATAITIEMILRYIPAILICSAAISAYLMMMTCIFIVKKFSGKDIKYPPFCSVTGTRQMCLMTFLSFIVVLFADEKSMVGIAAANVAAVSAAAFAVCGLAAIDFMFGYRVQSGYVRAAVYAGAAIIGFPLLSFACEVIAFLGFFDAMNSMRSFIFFVKKDADAHRNNTFGKSDGVAKDNKEVRENSKDTDSSDGDGNDA